MHAIEIRYFSFFTLVKEFFKCSEIIMHKPLFCKKKKNIWNSHFNNILQGSVLKRLAMMIIVEFNNDRNFTFFP